MSHKDDRLKARMLKELEDLEGAERLRQRIVRFGVPLVLIILAYMYVTNMQHNEHIVQACYGNMSAKTLMVDGQLVDCSEVRPMRTTTTSSVPTTTTSSTTSSTTTSSTSTTILHRYTDYEKDPVLVEPKRFSSGTCFISFNDCAGAANHFCRKNNSMAKTVWYNGTKSNVTKKCLCDWACIPLK